MTHSSGPVGASAVEASELQTLRSVCRICVAGCGIEVDVAAGRIISVRGDREHPSSHGYLCSKARGYPLRHHSENRLAYPTIRGQRVSWGECLDDIAASLRRIIDDDGPGAVGCYVGTGAVTDATGRWSVQSLLRSIGSRQIYSATTVDIAPVYRAAELVTGFYTLFPTWNPDDTDGPDLAILLGFNPIVSHGYANVPGFTDPVRRLRGYRNRGGAMWVVDPRRTETAMQADHHLAVRPGSDAALLAWLVRELLDSGADTEELAAACFEDDLAAVGAAVAPFTLALVAQQCGVGEEILKGLLGDIRASGKIVVATGTGVAFGRHALVTAWLQWVLLIITGSLDCAGGMRFSSGLFGGTFDDPAPVTGRVIPGPVSRPELNGIAGERPTAALPDEIEAGELRALFVNGGNLLTALPDPDRVRKSLGRLDICVVVDTFQNEMTANATHALPATWHFERADAIFFSGRPMYCPPIVEAAEEQRPTWWTYDQLGRRLGHPLLGSDLDSDVCTDEEALATILSGRTDFAALVAAGPHGRQQDEASPGWVRERVLPQGRWRLAPKAVVDRLRDVLQPDDGDLRLVSGRQIYNNNSVLYASGPRVPIGEPPIGVSRADADAAGIDDGDWARVSSRNGAVFGRVGIDDRLPTGAMSITHGHTQQNVGQLTDSGVLDVMTGQPEQSALSVTLMRLESTPSPRFDVTPTGRYDARRPVLREDRSKSEGNTP